MTTTAIPVSTDTMYAALAQAVEDRGAEYVYPEEQKMPNPDRDTPDEYTVCRYVFTDGTPGCIAGAAFANLGVPLETLALFDLKIHSAEDVTKALAARGVFDLLDVDAQHVVLAAQSAQDAGLSWGEALTRALGESTIDHTSWSD